MANYETLKAAIADVIKTNGTNAITGAILQQSLLSMISSLGAGYQFMGVAQPSTDPGTPDQNVFYVGGPGEYSNFGSSVVVGNGKIVFFYYNGTWGRNIIDLNTGVVARLAVPVLDGVGNPGVITIDNENATLTIPQYSVIHFEFLGRSEIYRFNSPATVQYWDPSHLSSLYFIVFNTSNNTLRARAYNDSIGINEYVLFSVGSVYGTHRFVYSDCPFIPQGGGRGFCTITCTSNNLPSISVANRTLKIPYESVVIYDDNSYYILPADVTIDLSGFASSLKNIVFNRYTKEFSCKQQASVNSNDIVLMTIRTTYASGGAFSTVYNICSNFPVLIDGAMAGGEQDIQFSLPASCPYFLIKRDQKSIVIPKDSVVKKPSGYATHVNYILQNDVEITYWDPDHIASINYIVFNINTNSFYLKAYTLDLLPNERVILTIISNYNTHNFIACNSSFPVLFDDENYIANPHNISYDGDIVSLNRAIWGYMFELSTFGTIVTSEIDSQGFAIYDDRYLFQGNQINNNLHIADMVNKTVNKVVLPLPSGVVSHMNSINCGGKYDNNDIYPLLYISRAFGTMGCDVVRVKNDLTLEILQSINYNGTTIDRTNKYGDWILAGKFIYHILCDNAAYGEGENLTWTFVKFNMPSINDGSTIEFGDDDILESFDITGCVVLQGSLYQNGKIYSAAGFGVQTSPGYLYVIDVNQKRRVSVVPFPWETEGEPEGVSIYKGELIMNDLRTNPYYYLFRF